MLGAKGGSQRFGKAMWGQSTKMKKIMCKNATQKDVTL